MTINVLLIAARTSRTVAYSQAIRHRGLRVSGVLIFGSGLERKPEEIVKLEAFQTNVFLPDLTEPLDKVVTDICQDVRYSSAGDINDATLQKEIESFGADLAIYSGYGAQIVGPELLNTGLPILHIHAGWLPRFRGSTTVYYEMLVEGLIGVSAIILAEGIDEGAIVKRKRYALPPSGMNIDHTYEPAIRADLLCDVLDEVHAKGGITSAEEQNSEEAETFYIIHPVLKHLAILGYVRERQCG